MVDVSEKLFIEEEGLALPYLDLKTCIKALY
jgi:hypothetical protein